MGGSGSSKNRLPSASRFTLFYLFNKLAAGAETDHHVPSSQNSSVSHYNIPQSNHLSLPSPMITYSTNGAVTTNLLHRSASKRTRLMLRSSANQSAAFSRARSRTLKLTLLIICSQVKNQKWMLISCSFDLQKELRLGDWMLIFFQFTGLFVDSVRFPDFMVSTAMVNELRWILYKITLLTWNNTRLTRLNL